MQTISKNKIKIIYKITTILYLVAAILAIIISVFNISSIISYAKSKKCENFDKSKQIIYPSYTINYIVVTDDKRLISKVNNDISEIAFYDCMYNSLTEKDIHMIETVVQHEVGNFSRKYKTLIAEIIYNRLLSEEFPDTVHDVVFQEGQFTGIEYWYSPDYEIDDETKSVVKQVFTNMQPSHDAVYYYNPELSCQEAVSWFEYSGDVEYLFSHTEEDWGVKYETKFYK